MVLSKAQALCPPSQILADVAHLSHHDSRILVASRRVRGRAYTGSRRTVTIHVACMMQ